MSDDNDPAESHLEGGLFAYGGNFVILWASLFIVLCTLFVALRFFSLRIGRRPAGLEDWLILPAWIIEVGLCANGICSVIYGGVGRHEAYILKYEPHALISWAQTLFVTELFYGIVFPIEKTVILLLYLRLFRIHHWFRLTTYVLITYIWLWGVSEVIVAIAQCRPIAYQWDKTIDGRCIDQLSYYRWVSVPNVIHDVVMLVLPLPIVWNLQIGLRQKLALSGVFLIGSLGCIASFVRLSIFFKLNALTDNTWASIQLQSWTLAETGVILISACLPALWPLVLRATAQLGTFRKGFSKGASGHDGLGSNRSERNEDWRGSRHGFMTTTSEFIPLQDVDDRTTTIHTGQSSTNSHSEADHGMRINVTTEVSWTINHEAEAPNENKTL
ncbi:putative integral membrane protein [Rosellinia necatrix]|uniref:Putative integral membrane protein n=1 Tax=Rosellinia necatrix TaxID=77044 RepID=A0A1S7UI79_ROSNE|nr:putative integral membrane protein [Rosellinia necatrix]